MPRRHWWAWPLFTLVVVLSMVVALFSATTPALAASGVDGGGSGTWPRGLDTNDFRVYLQEGESLQVSLTDVRHFNGVTLTAPDGTVQTGASGAVVVGNADTASTAGVWQIRLAKTATDTSLSDSGSATYTWSITVHEGLNATGTEIAGRLWTYRYRAHQGATADEFRMWVVNDTGYLYRLTMTDYNGINSNIIANSLGGTDAACSPSHKSWGFTTGDYGAGVWDYRDECGETYRLFYEEPDYDVLPETWTSPVTGATEYVLPAEFSLAEIGETDLSYQQTDFDGSGVFTYQIDARFSGTYQLRIDVDGDGLYDNDCTSATTGGVDRCEELGAIGAVAPDADSDGRGEYSYAFDSLDNQGAAVPANTNIAGQLVFNSVGEVHLLQEDVEGRGGIEIVYYANGSPVDDTIYWDDSSLTTSDRFDVTPQLDATAGTPSTGGVHGWSYGTNADKPWGNNRWIDDWTLQSQEYTTPSTTFPRSSAALTKTSTATADTRAGDVVTYTITATNNGTTDWNPLSSPTVADDMSGVLDDGEVLEDEITATVDGVDVGGWTYTEPRLTWKGTLAKGKTVEITVPVRLGADGDGDVLNTAWMNPAGQSVPEETPACDDASLLAQCVQYYLPSLTVEKSASSDGVELDGTSTAVVGQEITYQVTVTNPGPGDFTTTAPASATDDLSALLSEGTLISGPTASTGDVAVDEDGLLTWSGVLAAEDEATITYTVEYTGGASSSLVNTACVPEDLAVMPCATVDIPVTSVPAMTLDKQVAGVEDVDGDDLTDTGDPVTYEFVVENTGNVILTDVAVEDPLLTAQGITVTCEPQTLEPKETATCTVSGGYELSEAQTVAGSVENTATATATTPDDVDPIDPVTDTATVQTDPVASATLVKTAEITTDEGTADVADADDVITYSFVLENTGNVTLTDVFVEDEMIAAQIGADVLKDACSVASLAPGATLECSVEYTVTTADIAKAGSTLPNTATGRATPPAEVPFEEPTDDESVPKAEAESGIEIVKDATPDSGLGLGDTVQYGFTVTNTGNVDLTDVVVSDPMVGNVTCAQTVLAPGASTSCTADAEYSVTEADLVAGQVENTATVTGTDPDGTAVTDEDSKTVTTLAESGLALVKHADLVVDEGTAGLADVGDQIRYWFEVTNTGNVTVTDVAITDEMLAGLGLDITCDPTTLAPGEAAVCAVSADYTVTEADVLRGEVANTATADGTVPDGVEPFEPPTSSTSTPTIPAEPGLAIVKAAELLEAGVEAGGNGAADVGEQIQYTFTVQNTGEVTITDVVVTDPMLAEAGIEVTCDADTLAPGASTGCRAAAPYPVTDEDVLAGSVDNEATATGKTPDGGDLSATDTEQVLTTQANPALDLVKTAALTDANENGIADAGEEITYAFTVTNTGTVTLTDLTLVDEMLDTAGVDVTCEATTLAPKEATTCTVSGPYTVTAADQEAGTVTNTATATAKDPADHEVSDDGTTTTPVLVPAPALTLVKTATAVDTDADGSLGLGEQVTYAFDVTNNGNVPLTGLVLTDGLLAEAGIEVTCPATELAVGQSVRCEATAAYTVTEGDIAAGIVHNEATATATDPQGTPVTGDAEADVPTAAPEAAIAVVKEASLADADGDGAASPGETILYSFTVTNTGNVALTGVQVADPLLTDLGIDVTCEATSLAPAASTPCWATDVYPVTEDDVLTGRVHNTATGTGTAPDGTEVSDQGEAEVLTAAAGPGIEVVKTASLADANGNALGDLGEQITYSFQVSNTGNVTLTDVRVDDPMLTAAGIAVTCAPTTLAPGASATCTAAGPYQITEVDLLAGVVHNAATGTGTPVGGGEPPTDGDEEDVVTSDPTPGIDVVKTASLADANSDGLGDAGEQITYTFAVTNTGNVTLTDVRVDDPMLAAAGIAVSCTSTTLTPGQATDCTATAPYTVTEADVLAGSVRNIATVTGTPPGDLTPPSDEDTTITGTPVAGPSLLLVKTAALADLDGDAAADLGEQITYSFLVTNNGNVTISDLVMDDPMLAAAGITVACEATTLAPGASATCTPSGTYPVAEADLIAGSVTNHATVTGTDPEGGLVSDDDDRTVTTAPPAPGIEVVKSSDLADTNSNALADAGEQITYSFQVSNTGNVTLTDVRVDDQKLADAGVTVVCERTTLAPGQSVTCTASAPYTVTEADVLAGSVHNEATATGIPPVVVPPPTDTGEDDVSTPDPDPGIEVDKSAALADTDADGLADAGEQITYTFAVTNTGNVTLTDVRVDDPMLAAAGITVACDPSTLAPGQSVTCAASAPYTVTEDDLLAGSVRNIATVTGTPPGDLTPPSDEDTTITGTPVPGPSLLLDKVSDLADANGNGTADAGEQITYGFVVTDNGNVTITDLVVDDPMLDELGITVTCDPTELAPGETVTCEASGPYTVTEADVLAGGVHNHAAVTGTTPGGEDTGDEDDDDVTTTDPAPGIGLDKSSDLADVNSNGLADLGEQITYSFEVTNTGNVSLADITVTDPMLDALGITVACDPAGLAPGETATCEASGPYTVTEADVLAGGVVNHATATGTTPDGENTGDEDDDNVTTEDPAPALDLVKASQLHDANGNGLADPGETISYGFTVTSTGNVTVGSVNIDDPMLAAAGVGVTCADTELAPGASTLCKADADYMVTEVDVLAGSVHNVATAHGTGPGDEQVDPPTDETEDPTEDPDPALDLVKHADLADTNGNGRADAGEQIGYWFELTSTGNVTVTGVQVDDPTLAALGITVTCQATELAPGATTRCDASAPYLVTEADVLAGTVHNQATATGTGPGDELVDPPTDETDTPTSDPQARLTLVKTADLTDTNGNGLADVGEQITYGFRVTNVGNVTVTEVAVDDPMLAEAGLTATCEATTLPPGASTPCTVDGAYTVTDADVAAGTVHNQASATGTDPGGEEIVPPTDDTDTPTPVAGASLVLDKSSELADTDGNGLADAGEQVTYAFTVTNNGTVTVSDLVVADPMLAEVGVVVACDPSTLAPGEQVTCAASGPYTVTEADVVAGGVVNHASVTGTGPDGQTPGAEDDDTVPTSEPRPALTLDKSSELADADNDGLADPGEQVTYAFAVTNTGNVPITDLVVADPMLAEVGVTVVCDPSTLAPGEQVTCAASGPYTVTEADVVAGGVVNHASVTGTGPDGQTPDAEDDDTVPTPDPVTGLELVKSADLADDDGNGLADVGEQITYAFQVTNTGNLTLTDVAVADPRLAEAGIQVTCDPTTLAPGEQVTCTAPAYPVTRADVEAGEVLNTATATGTAPEGSDDPSAEDTVTTQTGPVYTSGVLAAGGGTTVATVLATTGASVQVAGLAALALLGLGALLVARTRRRRDDGTTV